MTEWKVFYWLLAVNLNRYWCVRQWVFYGCQTNALTLDTPVQFSSRFLNSFSTSLEQHQIIHLFWLRWRTLKVWQVLVVWLAYDGHTDHGSVILTSDKVLSGRIYSEVWLSGNRCWNTGAVRDKQRHVYCDRLIGNTFLQNSLLHVSSGGSSEWLKACSVWNWWMCLINIYIGCCTVLKWMSSEWHLKINRIRKWCITYTKP